MSPTRLAAAPAERSVALAHPVGTGPWSCDTGLLSDLLLRCGRGDRAALARLFDLLAPEILCRVSQLVGSASIDQYVNAVFVDLWRTAPAYHPEVTSSVDWVMSRVSAASARYADGAWLLDSR